MPYSSSFTLHHFPLRFGIGFITATVASASWVMFGILSGQFERSFLCKVIIIKLFCRVIAGLGLVVLLWSCFKKFQVDALT